jgi:hypothetical protein
MSSIKIPDFTTSNVNMVKELKNLNSELLAEAQSEFDRQIIEDLNNAKEAEHQYALIVKGLQVEGLVDRNLTNMPPQKDCNDLILKAINDHLAEKGIDPSTVELKFNGYEVKYDGTNVIVEEWKKL